MPLTPGTRLGPYEVIGPLGAGGMGEVYRARDTRLERTVALKILPEHLAADPAFKARFEREARAVSALSHPHICTLYDIGEQAGVHFLVMEHLEGETLAARLGRGSLPLEQALVLAAQVCEALALAHRHGVVHRDLKPANVMLTRTGAKLLDFGLAKQGPQAAPPISSALMTEASPLTAQGTIVGTWQYMAPEQLEGLEADQRSDIFAFGAMLYEMIAGRRAFEGRSQASLIAAIMGSQPPSLFSVAAPASAALDRIVRRCLAKDPEDRWQSAADLASELKWLAQGGAGTIPHPPDARGGAGGLASSSPAAAGPSAAGLDGVSDLGVSATGTSSGSAAATSAPISSVSAARSVAAARLRTSAKERMIWALVTLALLAAVAYLFSRARPIHAPPRVITASLLPPLATSFDTRYAPAISPDGKKVAIVVVGIDGKSSLYLRDLESDVMKRLPEADNAAYPFWSPDSRWIGFFTGSKLAKIDSMGGPAIELCDAQDGRGGSWSKDGIILFQPRFSDPLFKVSAGGGQPEPATRFNEKELHVAHRWPRFLPDGRHFLFYVVATTNPATSEHSGIYFGSLDSPEIHKILRVDSQMAYASGNLLFKRGTTLLAQPFDAVEGKLQGDPKPVATEVSGGFYSWGGADFDVSEQGTLVVRAGAGTDQTELVWFDRNGKRLGRLGEPDYYVTLRLSRDGRKLAASIGRDAEDIWLYDLEHNVQSRFTFDPGNDSNPVFSPDGKTIAFNAARPTLGDIYSRETQGTAEDKPLYAAGTTTTVMDWSPDGKYIVFASVSRKTANDIWIFSLASRKAEPWLERPQDEAGARIAPNGRWIAYTSGESGRDEVYVQAFPAKGEARWQVSTGGVAPSWRADGKELFYISLDNTMMSVQVQTDGTFSAASPVALFKMRLHPSFGSTYDVSPDGQRFIANSLKETDRSDQSVTIVLNWPSSLKK